MSNILIGLFTVNHRSRKSTDVFNFIIADQLRYASTELRLGLFSQKLEPKRFTYFVSTRDRFLHYALDFFKELPLPVLK